MDIDAFTKREKMLTLREELLAVEEARLNGETGYTVNEVAAAMKAAVAEVRNG